MRFSAPCQEPAPRRRRVCPPRPWLHPRDEPADGRVHSFVADPPKEPLERNRLLLGCAADASQSLPSPPASPALDSLALNPPAPDSPASGSLESASLKSAKSAFSEDASSELAFSGLTLSMPGLSSQSLAAALSSPVATVSIRVAAGSHTRGSTPLPRRNSSAEIMPVSKSRRCRNHAGSCFGCLGCGICASRLCSRSPRILSLAGGPGGSRVGFGHGGSVSILLR